MDASHSTKTSFKPDRNLIWEKSLLITKVQTKLCMNSSMHHFTTRKNCEIYYIQKWHSLFVSLFAKISDTCSDWVEAHLVRNSFPLILISHSIVATQLFYNLKKKKVYFSYICIIVNAYFSFLILCEPMQIKKLPSLPNFMSFDSIKHLCLAPLHLPLPIRAGS